MSSETNCPVAFVPAPPAVTVRAPLVPIVPAREPAEPAVVDVMLPKFATSPTVTAADGIASPAVYD